MINLRSWVDNQGIHPQIVYRRFRDGVLPVLAHKMGKLILVGALDPQAEEKSEMPDKDGPQGRSSTKPSHDWHGQTVGAMSASTC